MVKTAKERCPLLDGKTRLEAGRAEGCSGSWFFLRGFLHDRGADLLVCCVGSPKLAASGVSLPRNSPLPSDTGGDHDHV